MNDDERQLQDLTWAQIQKQRQLDFVRFLSCAQHDGPGHAAQRYLERYKGTVSDYIVRKALDLDTKAAVAPGTSTNTSWAGALVNPLATAFVEFARSESLLGRIPNLRRVPFNVRVPLETQGASYAWVAENSLIPTSKLTFDPGVTMKPTKAMAIIVTTKELALLEVPGTEPALRDTLVAGMTAFTDAAFLSTAAAIAGQQPPGILNGVAFIAGTGNLQTDVKTLIAAFFAGRPGARDPVIVANGGNAAAIRSMSPGFGFDVITSEAAGVNVIMLDPRGILVADDGAAIAASDHAQIEMDTAPVGTAASIVTSMWQTNSRAFRVERFVNWQPLPGAVKYLVS